MSRLLTSGVLGRKKADVWLYKGEVWEYEEVTSPHTGRVWMDRNLGASRVAQSFTDTLAFGDCFQWGRLDDLHQNTDSLTISTLSSEDVPDNDGKFILTSASPHDWRDPKNDNLWQSDTRLNLPAPAGWRIPTMSEWLAEADAMDTSITDLRERFGQSFLKLTPPGRRNYTTGNLEFSGSGYYWANNVSDNNANRFTYSSSNYFTGTDQRARGCSVRLIKEI